MSEEETRLEIRKVVQEEMAECFADLKRDVAELKASQSKQGDSLKRIESGLFGDRDLSITGLAEQIHYSYGYAKTNTETQLVTKGWETIKFVEGWNEAGNWKTLLDVIEKYKAAKVIMVFLGATNLLSIIAIFVSLTDLINRAK